MTASCASMPSMACEAVPAAAPSLEERASSLLALSSATPAADPRAEVSLSIWPSAVENAWSMAPLTESRLEVLEEIASLSESVAPSSALPSPRTSFAAEERLPLRSSVEESDVPSVEEELPSMPCVEPMTPEKSRRLVAVSVSAEVEEDTASSSLAATSARLSSSR